MREDKRKPNVEYRGKTTVDEKTYIKVMATLTVLFKEYKKEVITFLVTAGILVGSAVGIHELREAVENGTISITEIRSSDNKEETTDEDYLMQFFDDHQIAIMDGTNGFYVSGRNPKQLTYDEALELGYEELVESGTMSLDSFCRAWHKCTGARIFGDWKNTKEKSLENRHKIALTSFFEKYHIFIVDGSDGFFVSGDNPEGLTYDKALELAYEELVIGKQMVADDFADVWHDMTGAKISKDWLKEKAQEKEINVIVNKSSNNN